MRGIIVLLMTIFGVSVVMLGAVPLTEALTNVVTANSAVQSMGWAGHATSIQETLLKYVPIGAVFSALVYAVILAFRRESFEGGI